MYTYSFSKEEQQYLEQYNQAGYERPSVATDMAIFSIMEDGERDNFRKLQKKALKLLLVKRAEHPFKDMWALPGGFCKSNEDILETAKRNLFEETNVKEAYLSLAGVFGDVGRDPRGWIVSNTFLALVDGNKCDIRPGEKVGEANWFSIELKKVSEDKEVLETKANVTTEYELLLQAEGTEKLLRAKVKEYKQFANYHESLRYEIEECEGIAFDHAKLILYSLLYLRKNVENDFKLGFDLLPETFTLTQLQNAFELVLNKPLLAANFRRKVSEYVIETEQVIEGAGHRPAKLFKRNVGEFYK